MKQKYIMFIVILMVILCGGLYLVSSKRQNGFNIEIENKSQADVSGLKITYEKINKDIKLPKIEAGKTYKTKITPKEDFVENRMVIYYKDRKDELQKSVVIGYFEKGYKGNVKVIIKSIDENGMLAMKIQNDIKI